MRDFIEVQAVLLQAAAANLTAFEMAGVAAASVLGLLVLNRLIRGKDPKQIEAEAAAAAAAMIARVNSLGLGQVCVMREWLLDEEG